MTRADNKRDLSIEKDKSDEGGMAAVPSKTRFDPLRDNDANNIFEILDPIKDTEQKPSKPPKQHK